jgi:uncharacterized iron-regulated membrane protein
VATRTYGIFWRWHFLAGVVACPVIFVVALTGALYAFQPEIERALQGSLIDVEPAGPRRPLDELDRLVSADCIRSGYGIPSSPRDAFRISCADQRNFMVDPYRGKLLGTSKQNAVFAVVFGLHWELLLGETGRLVIEWATSWTLLLMMSGAYLWWPRGKTGGAWWPRRGPRITPRLRLRDLHSIFGAYALPCLLAIAATGLFWTRWAGEGRWHRLEGGVVDRAMETPPSSTGTARITPQQALVGSGLVDGRRAISIVMPAKSDAPYLLFGYDDRYESPSLQATVYVDAYSGARVRELYWKDLSALSKIDRSAYSIHIGALFGLPGRILACLAAVILAGLTITGPWMWWKRRPRKKLGVPPPPDHVPRGLLVAIAALGWLLPTVGWTLIAVLGIELGRWLWRRRERSILDGR